MLDERLLRQQTNEKPYVNQLHEDGLQIAEQRPGLDVETQLLLKVTAKGDLESGREMLTP